MTNILLIYRPEESSSAADSIHTHLGREFGVYNVTKGIAATTPDAIQQIVARQNIILVLIGSQFFSLKDDAGKRLLDNSDDILHKAIAAALSSSATILPVLVNDAPALKRDDLPYNLQSLAKHKTISVRSGTAFDTDIQALIAKIKAIIEPEQPAEIRPLSCLYVIVLMSILLTASFACINYIQRNVLFLSAGEVQETSTSVAASQTAFSLMNPTATMTATSTATDTPTATSTSTATPTATMTATSTSTATATDIPTDTAIPATATALPSDTPIPPTNTPVPPTATALPTNTPVPPTATDIPTNTPVPPTATAVSAAANLRTQEANRGGSVSALPTATIIPPSASLSTQQAQTAGGDLIHNDFGRGEPNRDFVLYVLDEETSLNSSVGFDGITYVGLHEPESVLVSRLSLPSAYDMEFRFRIRFSGQNIDTSSSSAVGIFIGLTENQDAVGLGLIILPEQIVSVTSSGGSETVYDDLDYFDEEWHTGFLSVQEDRAEFYIDGVWIMTIEDITPIAGNLAFYNGGNTIFEIDYVHVYAIGENLPSLPLTTPVLVSPADGTVFNHYPRTTILEWLPVQNATGYWIDVDYCQGTIESPRACRSFFEIQVDGLSYEFEFAGAQPGRWRVAAIDINGELGEFSDWFRFEYTQ